MVQWLRYHASTAGGTGSDPGQGTKIPHAMQHGQKKKKEKKNCPHQIYRLRSLFPQSSPVYTLCVV